MKKTMLIVALVVGFTVVFGCKSQPKSQPSVEDALRAIYDRYRAELILDGAETYTVVEGDSLHEIAGAQYHDRYYYPLILLASSDIIVDEDQLTPGMELTIPNLQANLDDPTARATLQAFLRDVADLEDSRNRSATATGMRAKADSLDPEETPEEE